MGEVQSGDAQSRRRCGRRRRGDDRELFGRDAPCEGREPQRQEQDPHRHSGERRDDLPSSGQPCHRVRHRRHRAYYYRFMRTLAWIVAALFTLTVLPAEAEAEAEKVGVQSERKTGERIGVQSNRDTGQHLGLQKTVHEYLQAAACHSRAALGAPHGLHLRARARAKGEKDPDGLNLSERRAVLAMTYLELFGVDRMVMELVSPGSSAEKRMTDQAMRHRTPHDARAGEAKLKPVAWTMSGVHFGVVEQH